MAERKQLTCNSFVFYGSFYEAISVLPAENQAHIYDAIFKFAFENIEVDLDGVELAVFLLIKPQLIANRARYENGCKGGRPRKDETEMQPNEKQIESGNEENENQNKTEQKPKHNLTKTKAKPNENDNENYISLLKILKNKKNIADVYAVGFRTELCDEVLSTLAEACLSEEPIRIGGICRTADEFRKVVDNFDGNKLCETVNCILQHSTDIKDTRLYILGIIANRFMK